MKSLKTTETIPSDDSDSLSGYFREIKDSKPLSAKQEAILAQRIHNGDIKARDILVNANLKFVVFVAKQYQNRGLPLPDLINEGNIGLIKAAEKFEGGQGVKFISYAVWWIRESILQALAKDGRTIRLPMNQIDLIGKINKAISEFENTHGRTPAENEIADILDIVDKKVSSALQSSQRNLSIDTPFSEDDDRTFEETHNVSDSIDPDIKFEDEAISSELQRLLSVISPMEQYVLGHFFGFGYKKMELREIAEELNYTLKKTQQIKDKGIRHLRERTKNKSLKKFLDNI